MYPKRYELEPAKRRAYCLAWDLLTIYGGSRRDWKPNGLDKREADEVWDIAARDISGRSSVCFVY